jgi:myo-inositol-1(or 4)-monophosphatase
MLQANSSYAIMSEETSPDESSRDLSWIVDPIDGTTNFASKIPLFAVSVALLRDQDVILGVILNPMTDECFYAEKGKGAYLNGQPLQVAAKTDPGATILFLNHGYPATDRKRYATLADRLGTTFFVRTFGPTALELCYLARGCAAGFICSGDELWDFAAGIVLVEEAGGKVTDWKGRHWDRSTSFILASNTSCHEELIAQIADLQP